MNQELVEDAVYAAAHLRSTGKYGASMSVCQLIDVLQAAAKAVGELPEYRHTSYCYVSPHETCPFSCGADEANAKRLAARKAVGLEG